MNYLAKELEAHAGITPRQRQYWIEQKLLWRISTVGVHYLAYTEGMMFRAALMAHIIKHTPISKCLLRAFIEIFDSTTTIDSLYEKSSVEDLILMLIFDGRTNIRNKKNERWYDLIILGPRSAWAPMRQENVYTFKLERFWPTEIEDKWSRYLGRASNGFTCEDRQPS